jgi:hypothetical protein
MKILFELLKIALGVTAGAAFVAFANINFHFANVPQVQTTQMSYADLAAINLTAATVVLGGVALVVAVAAVFGFQIIRSESVANAGERVKSELPEMVERELKKMENDGRLTGALARSIYSGGPKDDDESDTSLEE